MLVTPFEPDGALDLRSLPPLIEAMRTWGIASLSALGFGGEALHLDRDERRAVATAAVRAADPLPVVIGCTARKLCDTYELALDAADVGAAALMIAPPTDERVNHSEMVDAYLSIAEAVQPTAVMIQDAPQWSRFALSPELVAQVHKDAPNVTMAKPEGTPASEAVSVLTGLGGLDIFGGLGGLHMLDQKDCGAAGVIPGCDTADVLHSIYERHDSDPEAARHDFERVLPLLTLQFQTLESYVVTTKILLAARGLLASPTVRDNKVRIGTATRRLMFRHAVRAGISPLSKSVLGV
jgi:dihydrodipicolinate synthase/N-acetylneuraminate lyase